MNISKCTWLLLFFIVVLVYTHGHHPHDSKGHHHSHDHHDHHDHHEDHHDHHEDQEHFRQDIHDHLIFDTDQRDLTNENKRIHQQENEHEHAHEHEHEHEHEHDHDHDHEHQHQNRVLIEDPQKDQIHEHDHQHPSGHDHHHHQHDQHDHDNHHHHHHHSDADSEAKYGPLLFLTNYTQNKQKLVFTSVVIVSLPSIPTFLVLLIIQKLFKSKSDPNQFINQNLISKLIAFSFGTLIGDVFLHILPHLLEGHIHDTHSAEHGHEPHSSEHEHSFAELKFYFYILGGIMFFILIDYLSIVLYSEKSEVEQEHTKEGHSHSHGHKHEIEEKPKIQNQTAEEKSQVLVFLFGDFLHNFTDGIALGASYSYNLSIGVSTTLAILMHETPHEIGDFAYLIRKKYSLIGIFSTQIATSIGCLCGAFVGLYFGEIYKEELLSLTAGGFLFMCLSSIFPDIRESFREQKGSFFHFFFTMCFIFSGIFIMYLVTFIE